MNLELVPRPAPWAAGREFWEAAAAGELRIQRCGACGRWRHPPAPRCAACHSADARWDPVAGTGTVFTYTEIQPPVLPAFEDDVPYVGVVVALAEGPLLVSRLVEHNGVEVRVGLPVEVVFVPIDEQLTLPLFRPAGGQPASSGPGSPPSPTTTSRSR